MQMNNYASVGEMQNSSSGVGSMQDFMRAFGFSDISQVVNTYSTNNLVQHLSDKGMEVYDLNEENGKNCAPFKTNEITPLHLIAAGEPGYISQKILMKEVASFYEGNVVSCQPPFSIELEHKDPQIDPQIIESRFGDNYHHFNILSLPSGGLDQRLYFRITGYPAIPVSEGLKGGDY